MNQIEVASSLFCPEGINLGTCSLGSFRDATVLLTVIAASKEEGSCLSLPFQALQPDSRPLLLPLQVKSAPYDHRFPSTNQARHCYTRYNEFHKCAAEKSEDECHFYQKAYRSVCPNDWVSRLVLCSACCIGSCLWAHMCSKSRLESG